MFANGKYYFYKNFRMTKTTAKKLIVVKKNIKKTWNKTFLELIEAYNTLHK